jgi:hypothetical protein
MLVVRACGCTGAKHAATFRMASSELVTTRHTSVAPRKQPRMRNPWCISMHGEKLYMRMHVPAYVLTGVPSCAHHSVTKTTRIKAHVVPRPRRCRGACQNAADQLGDPHEYEHAHDDHDGDVQDVVLWRVKHDGEYVERGPEKQTRHGDGNEVDELQHECEWCPAGTFRREQEVFVHGVRISIRNQLQVIGLLTTQTVHAWKVPQNVQILHCLRPNPLIVKMTRSLETVHT